MLLQHKTGDQYYHMGEDNSMQINTWIGSYYVDSNSVWLTIFPMITYQPMIDGVIYTFDENGVATPETPHYK